MASKSANQLVVDVQRLGSAAVVRVQGSAGMGEAKYLQGQLEDLAKAAVSTVILDLSELEYISSAGLGALLSARAALQARGGRIRLINPRPFVHQVLETTCLDRVFGIFPSLDEALDA